MSEKRLTEADLSPHDAAEIAKFKEFLSLPRDERKNPKRPEWRAYRGLPPIKDEEAKP